MLEIQLDEHITLHVRAANSTEARAKARTMAEAIMPGEFALVVVDKSGQYLPGKPLWDVKAYPAPKGL